MVKIYVGNLASSTTKGQLHSLFSSYGKIKDCDVMRNFGFVYMDDMEEAAEAVSKLNQCELNGQKINVELSRKKPRGTTKLHVSNINLDCTNQELRAKFEGFGPVVECDIVKDYAFVHMEREEDATEAIMSLDKSTFQGKVINVQRSTSRFRTAPGMGDTTGCYVCGEHGHWSRECKRAPNGGREFSGRGSSYSRGDQEIYAARIRQSDYSSDGYLSKPVSYLERSSTNDPYSAVDYYEKYRTLPLESSYLDSRHIPIPPPPPPSSRLRLASSSVDVYSRRYLPPPPPPLSSYYSRDRSPIRRIGGDSEGYSYERLRLSPVPRSSSYVVSRARNSTERARYAY